MLAPIRPLFAGFGLLLFSSVAYVEQPEKSDKPAARKILDAAKFFSPEAKEKAEAEIAEIKRLCGKDLLIETVPSLKLPQDVDPKDKVALNKFLSKWATEQFSNYKLAGVYVVFVQDPNVCRFVVGSKTRDLGFFTDDDRRELARLLAAKLKAGVKDDALLETVTLVRRAMTQKGAQKKTPQPKPLTAEQKEKLKARDALWKASQELAKEGKLAEAITAAEKVLAVERVLRGDDHTEFVLEHLARLRERVEDFDGAIKALTEVLRIKTKRLGDKAWQVTDARLNLERLEHITRLDAGARTEAYQADEIMKRAEADIKPGSYEKGARLAETALAIRERIFGRDHHQTAKSAALAGLLFDKAGDFKKARPHLEQSLAISKKALGDHPAIVWSLERLGRMLSHQGEYAAARACCEQAFAIHKKVIVIHDPALFNSAERLGRVLYDQGDYAAARPIYEHVLAYQRKTIGPHHLQTAVSLNRLGSLLLRQGEIAAARAHYEEALAISRRALDLASITQSEHTQLAVRARLDYLLGDFLNLPCETAKEAADAHSHALAWKGSVLAHQQRLRLERALDPKLAPLVEELRVTAGQLSALSFASSTPEANKRLYELHNRKEALERELAQKSRPYRKDRERQNLSAEQLVSLLPVDAALVDFVVYAHWVPDKDKKEKGHYHDRLLAFILKPGADIVRLDFGSMAPIDKAIDAWRAATRKQPGKDHPGVELRRLLWEPLEKHIAGVKTVLLSPDGALARLPFAALPEKKAGTYLLEEVNLAVVPIPRLLPELLEGGKQAEGEPSLLLVGDVDFNAAAGKSGPDGRSAAIRTGERRNWDRLEGTRGEILSIRDSFEQRFADAKVKVLRGEQATEAALRQLGSKYSVLHIATHGFFADPKVRSALANDDKERGDFAGDLFGEKGVTGFHPGLLSGLVLAGANQPPQLDRDDGILTALEVAELDLRKADLAVLSACETGLGKVAAGEGILGLQRAFQVAGARTVVTSLWSVDDKATRALMERFYENMWKHKMPRAEALRQAQIWMLREGERGLARLKTGDQPSRLPPYYWAAFVVSGDWR